MKNKKLFISVLSIVSLVLLIVGGTYAFWVWELSNEYYTNVAFTTQGKDFSCSADGGGNITSDDVMLQPAKCTDTNHAIVREINTNVVNNSSGNLRLDLWLNINSIDTELANSTYFEYAITDSNEGCDKGTIIKHGNFRAKGTNDKLVILEKDYSSSDSDTYYLYIWLDEGESDASTASKSFNMSLGGECSDTVETVNKPYIKDSGLIPVKLSDTGDTVTTVSVDDSTWYNYADKKWANAVLVNEDTNTRDYYLSNSGVTVPQTDILAYYVWIPRYSYRVWQYSGVSSKGDEQEIDIKFINSDKELATRNGEWHTHPAFTFGDIELSGIWVGKFETSHTTLSSSSTANNLGCTELSCTNYTGLRVLPNVVSIRYNTVGSFFYASRYMEEGGFGLNSDIIDSHMMKNSEWGAVAYLSHSKYGINGEVRTNNRNNYTTGCGALTATAGGNGTCSNVYGTQTDYPQSTTGNVTGIFDMAGGALEYVMGIFKNDFGSASNSGFSKRPDLKYYDIYPSPQFNGDRYTSITNCTFNICNGHALNETKNWYGEDTTFVGNSFQVTSRGGLGTTNDNKTAGIFATSSDIYTNNRANQTFRLVLVEE